MMEASTDVETPEECQLKATDSVEQTKYENEIQKEPVAVTESDNLNDVQANRTAKELQPETKDAIPESPTSELNISKAESTVSSHEDDTSSGSPSPIPDDSNDGLDASVRPKVRLGKDISMMMKALNCLKTPEEKIAALCKKYADLLEQHKLEQKRLRALQKKHNMLRKEHDQLQATHNKTVLVKSNMESLARELNKQNKLLKEETYVKMTQMEKDKEQVTVKFQAAIDEISGKIESIAGRNAVLHEENKDMGLKIAALSEEASSREQAIEAMKKHHSLHEKLLLAKLQKAEEEKMASLKEQEKYVMESLEKKVLCEAYKAREKELRVQLKYYSDKFEDFQSTLENSNKMFSTFRSETNRMNKKIKELEKDTAMWQQKWSENETTLKLTILEKSKQEKSMKQLEQKQTLLTNLSRALQTERNEMAKKIKCYEQKEKSKNTNPEKKSDECTEFIDAVSPDEVQGNVKDQQTVNKHQENSEQQEVYDEHQENSDLQQIVKGNQDDTEEQQTIENCDFQQHSKKNNDDDNCTTQTKCTEPCNEAVGDVSDVQTSEGEVVTDVDQKENKVATVDIAV